MRRVSLIGLLVKLPSTFPSRDSLLLPSSADGTARPFRLLAGDTPLSVSAAILASCLNRSTSNCRSWSIVILRGTPNRAIHVPKTCLATVSAVMSSIGIASGHHVKRSTIVRQYLYPLELGSGPTISTWTCSNLFVGPLKSPTGVLLCRVILALWHCMHARAHCLQSFPMLGHMYLAETNLAVALTPGCAKLCKAWYAFSLNPGVT